MFNCQKYNFIPDVILLAESTHCIVKSVRTIHKYIDGKPTEELDSSNLLVERSSDKETLLVKIKDQGMAALQIKPGQKVTFVNLHGTFYVNSKNYLDMTIRADAVNVLEV